MYFVYMHVPRWEEKYCRLCVCGGGLGAMHECMPGHMFVYYVYEYFNLCICMCDIVCEQVYACCFNEILYIVLPRIDDT